MGIYETHALQEGILATQVIGDAPVVGPNNEMVPRNLKINSVGNREFDPVITEKILLLED
jgi:hypothetical protein